jgi:ubiquinol-cytochrome c reductase iron-sulfur subunit
MSQDQPGRIRRLARLAAAVLAVRRLSKTEGHSETRPAPKRLPESLTADVDPRERSLPRNPRAELLVAVLLALAGLFGFGFVVIYIALSLNTQLLGLAIGGMLALLAAAAIVAGKLVVPQEISVEERDALLKPAELEEVVELVESGGEGVSRRGLLACTGALAGAGLVAAGLTPLASLGPRLSSLHYSPWTRGRRMVDEDGNPYLASNIEVGSFYTALPEDENWEQLGAPVLLVKLPGKYIHLPDRRRAWAPQGILAYSKICTHAGCAISLYRYPTFAPDAGSNYQPAFTCPCHYSTFLPGEGGKLIFGPAGRPLPQLPVMIDADGYLRAAGRFDGDVGPAWVDVRRPPSST